MQGTACITLAGLLSAARATGKPFSEHRVLFLGAGEAGTGIGELIAQYLHLRHGVTLEEGREHCYFLDSKVGGWVCCPRGGGGFPKSVVSLSIMSKSGRSYTVPHDRQGKGNHSAS